MRFVTSAKRKKRAFNRYLRDLNKNLANDIYPRINDIVVKEVEYQPRYNYIKYEIIDTLTNSSKITFVNSTFFSPSTGNELWWAANDFVINIRRKEGW